MTFIVLWEWCVWKWIKKKTHMSLADWMGHGVSEVRLISEHMMGTKVYHGPQCAWCRFRMDQEVETCDTFAPVRYLFPDSNICQNSGTIVQPRRWLLINECGSEVYACIRRMRAGYTQRFGFVSDVELHHSRTSSRSLLHVQRDHVLRCLKWLFLDQTQHCLLTLLSNTTTSSSMVASMDFWRYVSAACSHVGRDVAVWLVLDRKPDTYMSICPYSYRISSSGRSYMTYSRISPIELSPTLIVVYTESDTASNTAKSKEQKATIRHEEAFQRALFGLIVQKSGRISYSSFMSDICALLRPLKLSVTMESNRAIDMESSYFGYQVIQHHVQTQLS